MLTANVKKIQEILKGSRQPKAVIAMVAKTVNHTTTIMERMQDTATPAAADITKDLVTPLLRPIGMRLSLTRAMCDIISTLEPEEDSVPIPEDAGGAVIAQEDVDLVIATLEKSLQKVKDTYQL